MKQRLRRWLARLLMKLVKRVAEKPKPPEAKDPAMLATIQSLVNRIIDHETKESWERRDYVERCHDLVAAREMQGAGPWLSQHARGYLDKRYEAGDAGKLARENQAAVMGLRESTALRESNPIAAQGSFGDLELMLQNVEWRREVNLSWIEFSRWGIQQIILVSRLYYIKNPIIRRLIDLDAFYVMGRGVDISSTDEAVNDAIQQFLKLNENVFGQNALSENQKRTNYDGNLFFVCFPDDQDKGTVPYRLIDATEIQDIVSNPDDTEEEWYYRRTWVEREFSTGEGRTLTRSHEAWYPSVWLKTEAEKTGSTITKLADINGFPVRWESPVTHAKFGTVGKWLFGCPIIYPALDWAKVDRRYLEACCTLALSLAQWSTMITTKGGQQALAGVKQQLSTTVGPTTAIWDQNPTAVNASLFAAGPGTTMEAFHSRAQALDPKEHVEFLNMACMVMGYPRTMLGELETANLATATTLDRPTELGVRHRQERLREILTRIILYAMNTQLRAPGGALREAIAKRIDPRKVRIVEAPREKNAKGDVVYVSEAARKQAGKPKPVTDLEVTVTFPAIREGDIPQLIAAVSTALTLNNKGGQIVGIDEKEGIRALFKLIPDADIADRADEIVELMYPSAGKDRYDPNRTKEDAAALKTPISTMPQFAKPGPEAPGGHPQATAIVGENPNEAPSKQATPAQEALARVGWNIDRLRRLAERRKKAA